jgi:WD40 repeat protein
MASPKKADGEIPKTTLKGHQGSVLCLDLSSPASNQEVTDNDGVNSAGASPSNTTTLLLSGSEDHTARIWDLREHRRRACLCIQTPGDVLSAVFAPNCTIKGEHEPAASSPFALDHTIYLAVGNIVLEYDLRHTKTPIVRQPTRNFGPVLQHQDEVNQISLAYGCIPKATIKKHSKKSDSKKGNKLNDTVPASNNLYLAACDDAGTVRFMDTDNTNTSTILHHDSKGVAVVPTCAFRTKLTTKNDKATSALELVSGGSDCKIHLWDLSRPK